MGRRNDDNFGAGIIMVLLFILCGGPIILLQGLQERDGGKVAVGSILSGIGLLLLLISWS